MKVSTKGRYGLRLMVELALQHGRGPLQVPAIAGSHALSGPYLHTLVTSLKAAGLVRAFRGPNGGLELARDPARITALEVFEVLEGPLAPGPDAQDPATGPVWQDLAQAMRAALKGHTLASLAERAQRAGGHQGSYVI